jgi:hypothetical protein
MSALAIGVVMDGELALDVLEALEMYAARIDRDCEVILRPDGGGEIMQSEWTRSELQGDEPTGFESAASFDSIDELRGLLA